jgi:hypothetical protein
MKWSKLFRLLYTPSLSTSWNNFEPLCASLHFVNFIDVQVLFHIRFRSFRLFVMLYELLFF